MLFKKIDDHPRAVGRWRLSPATNVQSAAILDR